MTPSPAPERSAWGRLIAPAFASLVALAVLISLGLWQLERKTWKEGLTAAIESRAFGPPGEVVPERDWPAWRASADEYRRVRLSGVFLHDKEVAVHGLAEERPGRPLQGFYVFTPLRRDDGSVVMVNRGFVPTPLRDPSRRAAAQTGGLVSVTGLVRGPEERGWFVPANDPRRDDWFVRSIAEMAAARGLGRLAPFYVDADATPNPGDWPRGGQTRIQLPNNHLQYALTWFGLAATLIGVFAAFAIRRLRPQRTGSGDELQP
ncbi:MAG: surfeit 1 [Enterovirga sp.]|nr:surfeit 1 [Enterovirga sp.]